MLVINVGVVSLMVPLGVLIMESVEFHFQNLFGLVLSAYFAFFHLPCPSSRLGVGVSFHKLQ